MEGNKGNKYGATSTETSQEAKHLHESRLIPGAKKLAQKKLNKHFTIPSSTNTFNISEKSDISFSEKVMSRKLSKTKLLKRGTPCFSNRKIFLFTDDEISNKPSWLESERRKHWNLIKVHELNNSKQCTTYDNEELLYIVDTDWTFRNALLLQIPTDELQVMQDSLETVANDWHPPPPPKNNFWKL